MKIEKDFLATSRQVRIFDVAEFSVHDGPGVRVVVYFQGCNARCDWCHSPHSQPDCAPLLFNRSLCTGCGRCVASCPNGVHKFSNGMHEVDRQKCTQCGACISSCPSSVSGVKGSALHLPTVQLSVSGLFNQIEPYIRLTGKNGGITLSGGEALLQMEAVEELLRMCKKKGYHTAVETSGLLPLATYKQVLPLVDLWLFGTRVITGKNGTQHYQHINEVLSLLAESKAEVLPRIPMVPGFFDKDSVLEDITGLLKRYSIRTVCLSPWNRDYDHYYNQSGISLRMAAPTSGEIMDCETKITSTFTHLNIKFNGNKQITKRNEPKSETSL